MKKISTKITIVGAGYVGSTIAFSLVARGIASEIVLIDANNSRAEGEAMDIEHGSPFFKESLIHAGDYSDATGSDIVIITAGTNQKPNETRLDLLNRNCSIMVDVARRIKQVCPGSILLIVSNPVDVMARVAQAVTGFPARRVIGSGTCLDSARLRYLLSAKFNIDSRNIHGYVLGEHGDSEFIAWSNVNIAGMNINQASDAFGGIMSDMDYITINDQTRGAAYEIINRKGATYYGIAGAATRIVEAIVRHEQAILPVSVQLSGQYGINDVYLSLPTVLGEHGVERIITPYLSEPEEASLHNSAHVLATAYNQLVIPN